MKEEEKKIQQLTAAEILEDAAKTFEERNAVYKDNAVMVANVMNSFHPGGFFVQGSGHHMIHLWYLVIVKLTRWVNTGMTHEDSIRDATVYLAMIESLMKKGETKVTVEEGKQ